MKGDWTGGRCGVMLLAAAVSFMLTTCCCAWSFSANCMSSNMGLQRSNSGDQLCKCSHLRRSGAATKECCGEELDP